MTMEPPHQRRSRKARLFIAVDIPEALKRRLEEVKKVMERRMKNHVEDVRWTEPYSWHITLLFIGEVDEEIIPLIVRKVEKVAEKFEEFTLRAERLGWAPPFQKASGIPRYRMLWTYFSENDAIRTLAMSLYLALRKDVEGLEKPRIPFYPHVTLARFRWTKASALPTLESLAWMNSFPVKSMVLWESRLRAVSQRYLRLQEFPLGISASRQKAAG